MGRVTDLFQMDCGRPTIGNHCQPHTLVHPGAFWISAVRVAVWGNIGVTLFVVVVVVVVFGLRVVALI